MIHGQENSAVWSMFAKSYSCDVFNFSSDTLPTKATDELLKSFDCCREYRGSKYSTEAPRYFLKKGNGKENSAFWSMVF